MVKHLTDQPDCGAWWRSWYEVEDLEADVLKLYTELKPFYQQLHAYVRRKLHGVYGDDFINLEAPIPAHLLGNIAFAKYPPIIHPTYTYGTYSKHALQIAVSILCDMRDKTAITCLR